MLATTHSPVFTFLQMSCLMNWQPAFCNVQIADAASNLFQICLKQTKLACISYLLTISDYCLFGIYNSTSKRYTFQHSIHKRRKSQTLGFDDLMLLWPVWLLVDGTLPLAALLLTSISMISTSESSLVCCSKSMTIANTEISKCSWRHTW